MWRVAERKKTSMWLSPAVKASTGEARSLNSCRPLLLGSQRLAFRARGSPPPLLGLSLTTTFHRVDPFSQRRRPIISSSQKGLDGSSICGIKPCSIACARSNPPCELDRAPAG